MNIKETKLTLGRLWTLYPNAPKLTPDDSEMTALAWCSVFAKFSIIDVWEAVMMAADASPRFIPTAMEIRSYCKKTLNTRYTTQDVAMAKFMVAHNKDENIVKSYQGIIDEYENAVAEYDQREMLKWEPDIKNNILIEE